MKINKDNYEAYFLDYFEGNLSPEEIEELMAFINKFPELKSELDSYENISLVPEQEIYFESKESLKKNNTVSSLIINEQNIEEFLIAEAEGIISMEEKEQLEQFLSIHSSYKKDQALYSHTRLSPDSSIIFRLKDSLKHKAIPVGNINELNYETYLVEEVEGSLSSDKVETLNQFFLLNPHLENERKISGYTKLTPDYSITFEDKESLKKKVIPIRKIVLYTLAAAASLTLIFTIPSLWNSINNPTAIQQLSSQKPDFKLKETGPVVTDKEYTSLKPSAALASNSYPSSIIKTVNQERPVNSARNTEDVPVISSLLSEDIISHDYIEPEFKFIRTSQMHYNEYIELYYNLKLAEQIQYAQINEVDKNPEKTLFNSFTSRVGELFAFNRKPESLPNHGVSVWTFAELGVKTYNNIAHDNVKLDLVRDEEGKVVNYNLYGDKLDLQRDLKK